MSELLANAPRFLLGGTASGTGKTTVTCAILQALVSRENQVAALKCGPDYIDPMFHREIIGAQSGNLDVFLCGERGVPFLLAKNSRGCRVSVIEGVMGYFDGISFDSDAGSSFQIARLTRTPAVLVANVRGMGRSAKALLRGFQQESGGTLRGVIFNRCSAAMAAGYRELAESLGMRCYGFLPPMPEASFESRHLGLVTAAELPDLRGKLQALGRAAEEWIDLDGLLALADEAPPLVYEDLWAGISGRYPVRIGVAKDRAFCFCYPDNLALFQELGAELCFFSPMEDRALPPRLDGLYLCGGYPEENLEALSRNHAMRQGIRRAVEEGTPTLAECGGFLYLLQSMAGKDGAPHPMAGTLPGAGHMTTRLNRFGYQTLRARTDNLLCGEGDILPAHEFHYSDSTNNGEGFDCEKNGKAWRCGHASGTMVAGYPHFHFGGRPELAERFLARCLVFQKRDQ